MATFVKSALPGTSTSGSDWLSGWIKHSKTVNKNMFPEIIMEVENSLFVDCRGNAWPFHDSSGEALAFFFTTSWSTVLECNGPSVEGLDFSSGTPRRPFQETHHLSIIFFHQTLPSPKWACWFRDPALLCHSQNWPRTSTIDGRTRPASCEHVLARRARSFCEEISVRGLWMKFVNPPWWRGHSWDQRQILHLPPHDSLSPKKNTSNETRDTVSFHDSMSLCSKISRFVCMFAQNSNGTCFLHSASRVNKGLA